MKRKLRTITATILAFALSMGIGTNSVYAGEYFDVSQFSSVSSTSKRNQIQTRNVATSTVKKAIRYALRNSDKLVASAARWIGKDAAKVIERNFVKASPVLNQLLKYDDLVWQTVQDQLTHVVGRQAAIWIRMALEWLL